MPTFTITLKPVDTIQAQDEAEAMTILATLMRANPFYYVVKVEEEKVQELADA